MMLEYIDDLTLSPSRKRNSIFCSGSPHMNVTLLTTPFSTTDLAEFESLSREVFGGDATDEWLASLAWRCKTCLM